jgi:PHD/YefM family antitoxin component YafN of YafNO toxin-antitoxin module
MRADNSHHLAAAARRRRTQALDRARTTIQEIRNTGQPITITALAARAGVSRAWLYAEPELRDDIEHLRTSNNPEHTSHTERQRASDTSLKNRLTLAHERIRELEHDNHQLQHQIARLHGQLRATNLGTASVADTVHDTNNMVKLQNDQADPR